MGLHTQGNLKGIFLLKNSNLPKLGWIVFLVI